MNIIEMFQDKEYELVNEQKRIYLYVLDRFKKELLNNFKIQLSEIETLEGLKNFNTFYFRTTIDKELNSNFIRILEKDVREIFSNLGLSDIQVKFEQDFRSKVYISSRSEPTPSYYRLILRMSFKVPYNFSLNLE